jgi:hypothetical protein
MRTLLALLGWLATASAALASGLGVGGPGGGGSSDTITVNTVSTKTQSVGFDISGTLSGLAVATGIDWQQNCTGAWTAIGSPTITTTTWTSTAADIVFSGTGSSTVCVREQPSTSITGISNTFTVSAGAETIAATNPGTLTAGNSYTQAGTYTNGPPAAIDYSYDSTSCGTAASSPTISGGNISFTATAPAAGSHTVSLCDHANHSIFGTSTSFTVNSGGFTGLGDVLAMTTYHSCARAYTAAYATGTGKLCSLKDTITNETCDVIAASTGLPGTMASCTGASNGQTIATWTTANPTHIAVLKKYNQVANGTFDLPFVSVSPGFVPSTGCTDYAGTTQQLLTASNSAATQPYSEIFVALTRSVSTQAVAFGYLSTGPEIGFDASGATAAPYAYGGALLSDTGAENAMHLLQAVFTTSPNAVFKIDGRTNVTGGLGTGSPSGFQLFEGYNGASLPLNGVVCEAATKAGDITSSLAAIHTNVAAFYGTP